MRFLFIKLPIKTFWLTISFISIMVNLMVYLYSGDMVVEATTGYTIPKWERIILALKEFYAVGI